MDAESGPEAPPSAVPPFPLPLPWNSRTVWVLCSIKPVSIALEGSRFEERSKGRVPAPGSCAVVFISLELRNCCALSTMEYGHIAAVGWH